MKLANSQKMCSSWLTVMLVLTMLMSFMQIGHIPGVNVMPVAKANTPMPQVTSTSTAILTVKIGDYIQFGKYNDEPIMWRVIHKDENGNPVLFADRILSIKAFDASGSYHSGDSDCFRSDSRNCFGSNYYPDSNIRQWLNSSSPNSGANRIDWIQNDPSASNIWSELNPYDTEKGFLANGNFTSAERSMIKPFMHKVLIDGEDYAKKNGGTYTHTYNSNISSVVQNYDTAYYKNVTDKVFLLSVKQLKEWVHDRGFSITAKPSAVAIAKSADEFSELNINKNWHYWLNTPRADYVMLDVCLDYGCFEEHYDQSVRTVTDDGIVNYNFANNGSIGIRPSLQLSLTSAIFVSGGTGTSSKPYMVTGDSIAPSAPSGLATSNVSGTGIKLSWSASTDNVGVAGYEVYQNGNLIKKVTGKTTSYVVSNLIPSTSYRFSVRALDTAGNSSGWSNELAITTATANTALKIGDYIQFGKYNNTPILWRVIHKDANGYPVLFADRILTIKSFDARGSYHSEYYRKQYGSNDYSGSNIRQWLNSSSPNSGSNRIDWIQNDPSATNIYSGHNPYYAEKGFLADGNFTVTERNLIKPLAHRVLLAGEDVPKKDGGTQNHAYQRDITDVVQNYDSAYYKNVTDQVFLLSVKQLKEWVYDRGWSITAKPTAAAVAKSTSKIEYLNNGSDWSYWLNSPIDKNSYSVRSVYRIGFVDNDYAYRDDNGVRPALLLNLKSTIFKSGGIGNSSNPYVVTGANVSAPKDTTVPSAPSGLGANSVSPTGLTLAWKSATDNVAVTGYDVYRNGVLVKTLPANATTWSVSGLRAGKTYTFLIRARDAAGNQSNGNSNGSTIQVKTRSTISIVGKTITVNGNTLNLGAGVEPATINGSIMVPFRPIFEALGLSVSYNATTKVIQGSGNGYKLSMKMNSRAAKIKDTINKTMPVAPTTIKGITMVPLRFIGEELGVVLTYRSK
jgi:chitodextrinase